MPAPVGPCGALAGVGPSSPRQGLYHQGLRGTRPSGRARVSAELTPKAPASPRPRSSSPARDPFVRAHGRSPAFVRATRGEGGIVALVKSMAHEVADHGITVNAVLPAGP